jgi:putative DNA primase/helicase
VKGPLLSQILEGCFRDDADKDQRIDLIGEICGAVAMGRAPWMLKQPKAFVLSGEHANNGKSQILDMIRGLAPQGAIASIAPSQFDLDPYRLKLRGKLLNTASELGTARTIASEAFKYLVTGDPMTVNVKYQDAVEFRARLVHLFATNVLPPFQGGMDRGVRRRLCVMGFTRVFEPHEMIEGIGSRVAAEEADALLTFAVAGASRLLKQGQYTAPSSCAAALNEWVFNADPVMAWLECRTEHAMGHPVCQRNLYSDFAFWARCEGFDAKHLPAINNFVARIKAHDPRIRTVRNGKGGKNGRDLVGLKLRADDPPQGSGAF